MSSVEIVESTERFTELRQPWGALLERSSSDTLFLTWEWLHTWWRHFGAGRKLRLLASWSGGALEALAPLAIRPRRFVEPCRRLELLGTGSVGSDYLDLIVARGGGSGEAALADALARELRPLALPQLDGSGARAPVLMSPLLERGWRASDDATNVCPYADLRGHSWDTYLESLGREHRYNFKRRLRQLREGYALRFDTVEREAERGEALRTLVALHRQRWSTRGGSDGLHTDALVAFHDDFSRTALERGWLRLHVLRLDGEPAAALYGFRYREKFYFYQSGFDERFAARSVGLVMMGLAIRRAIEDGAEEYDMLHGAEAYKSHWARRCRELRRLELYPPTALGILSWSQTRLERGARRMVRRVLLEAAARGASRRRPSHLNRGVYAAGTR